MENTEMTLNEYQRAAVQTAIYKDDFYPVASLMVESAELADLFVKPMLRGDEPKEDFHARVLSEAGDVLWNLACLLDDCGIDLEDVADYNIQKLAKRANNGTIMGSGEDR